MSKVGQKSKLAVAFVSGGLFVALLQISPLKASTGAPTGSCVMMGNYTTWGWTASSGAQKDWNELAIINFDTGTASVMVNRVTARNGEPEYVEGSPESSSFNLSSGPMPGTYKMNFRSEYAIAAPANGGNTIFILDAVNGMTGVCQKL